MYTPAGKRNEHFTTFMNQHMRIWYVYYCQAMKAQVSLRKCTDLPKPLLLTYTKYVRLLALLDMSAWVFKDGFVHVQ